MYLNVYVPALQRVGGVASFFRFHRGHQFASSALMDPITKAFIAQMEQFAKQEKVPIVPFEKGQRKDDVAAEYRKKFTAQEGVLFIGKAQEKTSVFRTERRRHEQTGATYPWLVRSTAMVNHYYVYCVDRDFGPFFLKFCTYFPYNAKLCLNGHEYLKQQLTNRGIEYEALDNGILSCDDPKPVQALCDGLSAEKIDGLLRKWFRKMPHPFTAKDRQTGYLEKGRPGVSGRRRTLAPSHPGYPAAPLDESVYWRFVPGEAGCNFPRTRRRVFTTRCSKRTAIAARTFSSCWMSSSPCPTANCCATSTPPNACCSSWALPSMSMATPPAPSASFRLT